MKGQKVVHYYNKLCCFCTQKKLLTFFIICIFMLLITMIGSYRAWENYGRRALVAEGLALSQSIIKNIQEYYDQYKKLPRDNLEAKLPNASYVRSRGVDRVEIIKEGVIVITYNDKVTRGFELHLNLSLQKDAVIWKCQASDNVAKRIDLHFLPKNCRNDIKNGSKL